MARLLAATSLTMIGAGVTPPARAQDPVDPPWRVGRLAQLTGSVSSHGAGSTEWGPATLNAPLTSGDALWTEPGAGAAMELADNLVALSDSTELDLATLDNTRFLATAPQGELFLDLRDVPSGDVYAITTPRGTVQLNGAGQYEIGAGDSATPTTISVVQGSAQIASGSFSLAVGANQTATVNGSDTLQGAVGVLTRDRFLSAELGRLAPAAPSGPPAVRYMTGGASLASYGSWQPSPQYGSVWYPRVNSDWAPYREGSWSYVAPWGWTWVDNEPWGFAPFHYGRWSQIDGRWGWVPGEQQAQADAYQQPAYAPALVDFVAAGVVVGLAAGALAGGFGRHGGWHGGRDDRDDGSVGWIPLGPHEPYRPSFNASRTYVQRLNFGRIDNSRTTITTINNYSNHNALTVVPAAAMARSEPVGRFARSGPTALGQPGAAGADRFQPVRGALPVHPEAGTRGLTPAAAQRFNIAAPAARAAAPGPAINPALFHPHELAGSRAPFRNGAAAPGPDPVGAHPAGAHPAGALGPTAGTPHPNGLPGLRGPGSAAPGQPGRPPAIVAPPHGPAGAPGVPAPVPGPARPNGLPALRAPGTAPPGVAEHHGNGSGPGHPPGAAIPGAPITGAAPPGARTPGPGPVHAEPPGPQHPPGSAPEGAHPVGPARVNPALPHLQAPAPAMPHVPPAGPEPFRAAPGRPEPSRPQPPRPEAPRPEPPRAAPAPHPQPAPRPQPPRPEPPRPAPRPQPPAPRPAPPAPHPAPAPRPAPAPAEHHDEHRGH